MSAWSPTGLIREWRRWVEAVGGLVERVGVERSKNHLRRNTSGHLTD